MSCTLTAFSVKVVATGQTAIKTAIAREALYEWNAGHAESEKRAFLPVFAEAVEEDAAATAADLLIAFFCEAAGAESDGRKAGSDLARQLKSSRPALIYLSEARAGLNESDAMDLENFRKQFPADAMIDSFKDEKEFRAKFAQKIDALVRYHPHFQVQSEVSAPPNVANPSALAAPASPEYSAAAKTLLMNACDDPEAWLARMTDAKGAVKIQVNGQQYSAPEWGTAFDELLHGGLIRDAGYNGQLFQISGKGFKFLEGLGKHPIGYIEELGGM